MNEAIEQMSQEFLGASLKRASPEVLELLIRKITDELNKRKCPTCGRLYELPGL